MDFHIFSGSKQLVKNLDVHLVDKSQPMLERSLMHASNEGREDNGSIVCKGTQEALTINEKMRTFCFVSKLVKIYNNIPLYKNKQPTRH